MSIEVGVNMEFIRSQDKSFAAGVERAAKLGYKFVEPMVHNGRELLSEAGYFHSFSLDDDPGEMKDILDQNGVKPSGLSAHCPLMRPEISVPYLQKAIRFAAAIGAPVVNTDEGIRPSWVSMDEAFRVMKYTLSTVLRMAERYGIFIGIEPHQSISRTTEGLLKIVGLVESPLLRVNYDTGNVYLAGGDPYEGLKAVSPLAGARPRQGHYRRARGCGTRQGDRHAGGMRLRRWRHRLAAGHRDLARRELQRRALRRVRHRTAGRPQPGASAAVLGD